MPIQKTVGYKASDGMVYATVEGAQRAELVKLFTSPQSQNQNDSVWSAEGVTDHVLENVDKLLEVLTTGPRSRPRARKAAGTTAPKRAAKRAAPAVGGAPAAETD